MRPIDDRNRFRGIEGIVLDAVGTLIEPNPSVSVVYAQAAQRQGVTFEIDILRERFREQFLLDEVDERRGPLATDEPTEKRRWRRIVWGCLPEVSDPDRAFEELWDHFGDASSWVVFPDVAPAVRAFHRLGWRVCVGSNFDLRLRSVIDGLKDEMSWVDGLVVSSEVGWRKPHPRFYRAACEKLDLPEEKVICVGDDLENDVVGPGKAGLRSVLIDRKGRAPAGLESYPDLHSLAEAVISAR